MQVVTFTSSVQVFRRIRCQQPNSTCCVSVAHELDFLSPVSALSCNQLNGSGLREWGQTLIID